MSKLTCSRCGYAGHGVIVMLRHRFLGLCR